MELGIGSIVFIYDSINHGGFNNSTELLLHSIERTFNFAEENDVKKKAKNLLKKIWKVKLGEQPLKIIIEDKSGNSAIISDKAKVEKLKK